MGQVLEFKRPLRSQEREFLVFVDSYRDARKFSPALADIAAALGCTDGHARNLALRLEDIGYVERDEGIGRSIRVVRRPEPPTPAAPAVSAKAAA